MNTRFGTLSVACVLRLLAIALVAPGAVVGCSAEEPSASHVTSRAAPGARTTNQAAATAEKSCDSAGAQWFKENYPAPDEQSKAGSGKATYTVHLRTSESRCYLESTAIAHIKKDGSAEVVESEIHRLIDLGTGKELGQFVTISTFKAPLMCKVGSSNCLTKRDWDALVAPYMED